MDDSFWKGLTFGAVAGSLAIELIRQFFGRVMRRSAEKGEIQRKLIREDIESLASKVMPLLSLAQEYYGKPSHQGKELAQKLKADLQVFANAWNLLDTRIVESRFPTIGNAPLISFRRSLTGLLDRTRPNALDINDPVAVAIFNATAKVQEALSKAKYLAA